MAVIDARHIAFIIRRSSEPLQRLSLEAGHSCQNLYLAGAASGAGICAVGACIQQKLDDLLKVGGRDEFAIYATAVGKIN